MKYDMPSAAMRNALAISRANSCTGVIQPSRLPVTSRIIQLAAAAVIAASPAVSTIARMAPSALNDARRISRLIRGLPSE
jgi:hypothetical protein